MGSNKKRPSKKKQSLSSNTVKGLSRSSTSSSTIITNNYPSYYDEKGGWLTLSIRSSTITSASKKVSSTNRSFSVKHEEHLIIMHPVDAKLLYLSNGDRVVILWNLSSYLTQQEQKVQNQKQQETSRLFAAICKVKIMDIKSSKKKVREGEAQISPAFLEERLFRALSIDSNKSKSNNDPSSNMKTSPINEISSPLTTNEVLHLNTKLNEEHFSPKPNLNTNNLSSTVMKTPSPSKSKFSFSKGGGGDLMISPSPSSTTPSKTTSKFSSPSPKVSSSFHSPKDTRIIPNIMVLPFQHICASPIAKQISHHLTYPSASWLTLEFMQNPGDPSHPIHFKSNSTLILEKLTIAAIYGSYLQKGDRITVPYQGLKYEYLVKDIQSDTIQSQMEISRLNQSFSGLRLYSSREGSGKEEKQDNKEGNREQVKIETHSNVIGNTYENIERLIIKWNEPNSIVNPLLYGITYDTKVYFHPSHHSLTEPSLESQSIWKDNVSTIPSLEEKYSKVGGLSKVLNALENALVTPLFQPWLYSSSSSSSSALRPPRGVLLFGPSGVGKTALTSELIHNLTQKARAFNMELVVQNVQCQSLISSSVVGENEYNLLKLFPSSSTPSKTNSTKTITKLVILDNIHLICPHRGGIHTTSSTNQMASTLLALLDGIVTNSSSSESSFQKTPNFVVLGITRNPSDLDPALRRPGRLDTEIEIPIPDDLARADIWRVQLSQYSISSSCSNEEYENLAKKAKGFTGADTFLAIKEAMRTSIVSSANMSSSEYTDFKSNTMTLQHLYEAIPTILPSSLRTTTQALIEIPKVHWSDIGGMEQAKQLLQEAISLPLTHPHLFTSLNLTPPKGVLLYGPPGCSKTLLARALATEGQMNFLAVKGPELLSKWLGESERALANLFRRARQASPCVIFFDEMDAIAGKRGDSNGGGGGSGGERILSQLLTELDGVQHASASTNSTATNDSSDIDNASYNNNPRVVVVGATNRPDLLDGALMRPGRMDRKIYVGVPDSKSREKILGIGLKQGKRCSDVNITNLAQENYTGGFSGAELIAICREAALFAIEEQEEEQEHKQEQETKYSSNHNGDEMKQTKEVIMPPPRIGMRHMLKAIQGMKRQITPEMLDFYARFQKGTL